MGKNGASVDLGSQRVLMVSTSPAAVLRQAQIQKSRQETLSF